MEALRAEIERKRKAKDTEFGGRKFVRVADINAAREAQQRGAGGAQAPEAAAPQDAAAAPVADAARDASAAPPPAAAAAAAAEAQTQLPKELEGLSDADAVARLRALGHPARLFGEGERDRLLRLHVAQRSIAPRAQDELGQGQQANEKQRSMRELEETAKSRRLEREVKARAAAAEAAKAPPGEPQSAEDATAAAFKAAAAALAAQRAEAALDFPDRAALHLRRLMEEWEAETAARADASPAWANSLEGRNAISTCRLTRDHIRPLFRLIKRRECPSDIERALWCIVKALQARNYREAGDLYVRVAIGNAPWPIGVTMVGIHERSAREKIQAQSTAHVMHDEQTRKYLQSVKRLITFAQRRYPSTPSMSLEFNSGVNGSDKQALLEAQAAGGASAGGAAAPLLALEAAPGSYNAPQPGGQLQDGWRANERDTRTWKSIMRAAYVEDKPPKA